MNKETIFQKIKNSKYSNISDFTIQRIIENGITKYKKEKDVIKYAKKELHIAWGIFFKNKIDFEKYSKDPSQLLNTHLSTNERKNFVETFYKEIFVNTENIKKIADYGCGLNPLNIPQMKLKKGTEYFAYDIYKDEIDFLNRYVKEDFQDIHFHAEVKDIFEDDNQEYDLVLLLKILPLTEHQKKGSTLEILEKLKTKYFVISFPLKSVSGRNVGMDSFYTENFEILIKQTKYIYKKILFDNEVIYIVKKS